MRLASCLVLLLLGEAAAPPPSMAQASPDTPQTATLVSDAPKSASIFSFNYGATSSPALNLLGLSPSKVQSSTGFTPFLLSVPSVFDGSSGEAIGLDISPAYAGQGLWRLSIDKYQSANWGYRALIRTRLDLAATNGTASTDATKVQESGLAMVLSTSLLDANDPLAARGGGPYFDACTKPIEPVIRGAIATSVTQWQNQVGDLFWARNAVQEAIDGQTLNPKGYKAQLASDAPRIVSIYRTVDATFVTGTLQAAGPTPRPTPDRGAALAELQDVFVRYAKDHAADPVGSARAQAYAEQVAVIWSASSHDPLKPPAGISAYDERQDAALFAQSPGDGWIGDAVAKLMQKSEFGTVARPNPVSGVSNAVLASRIADHLTEMKAKLDQAYALANKAYTSGALATAFNDAGVQKAITTCSQATAAWVAARPDLNLGLGLAEAGTPGRLSHLQDGGQTAFLALRVPLLNHAYLAQPAASLASGKGDYLMAGGSIDYTNHASVATGNSTTAFMDANVLGAWLGVQGYSDWLRGGLQGGYTRTEAIQGADKKFSSSGWRWLTSASLKVNDTLWAGASYGTANGSTAKLDDHTLLVTLTFGAPKTTASFPNATVGNPPPSK